MAPNKALQTDKVKLSCHLHSQKPRQLAFAAELGRYTSFPEERGGFLTAFISGQRSVDD